MILRFLHGWGLDARLWDGVAPRLPGYEIEVVDRGYFGAPRDFGGDGPVILIAHSFGTLLALGDLSTGCLGLVAVNGFDRFTGEGDVPGVNRRVIDRMLTRFAEDPAAVLADFRKRCGDETPVGTPDLARLRRDLEALREGDRRAEAARFAGPILSLQGAADPILPPSMRDAVFAGAAQVERLTHAHAGHLLPASDPAWCATRIARFAESVA